MTHNHIPENLDIQKYHLRTLEIHMVLFCMKTCFRIRIQTSVHR